MSASCRKVWNIPELKFGVLLPIPLGWVIFLYTGGEFYLILKNNTENNIIAENIIVADSFLKRLKGLMFTKQLSSQSGMLIHPCNSIHTYFMNYTIDVLYLDINNIIIAIDEDMKPGKVGRIVKSATTVVELNSGKVKETNTKVGQAVEFV